MKIPLTIPYLNKLEKKELFKTLRSGWLAQGPQVAKFEEEIRKVTETKYSAATSSATTALYLSLLLLDIKKGDEVIVPSFTFIATSNVVLHAGATPVFVDINYDTLNIDTALIEEKITKRTKVLIPVDYAGIPCNIAEINIIAKRHNLKVIEDAAAALGSRYNGRLVGSLTDLTCFSFHARKIVTTGEGGIITTQNKSFADKAKILRHHGMAISDTIRHKAKRVIHEGYPTIGYNFRMSDLQAAVGLGQIKKINEIIKKRTELAEQYSIGLRDNELIQLPIVPEKSISNWQSYIIKLRKNKYLSRDKLMQKLLNDGISTRRGAIAIHKEKAYRNIVDSLNLPMTEEACNQTITLPLFPQMTQKQQDYVLERLGRYTRI